MIAWPEAPRQRPGGRSSGYSPSNAWPSTHRRLDRTRPDHAGRINLFIKKKPVKGKARDEHGGPRTKRSMSEIDRWQERRVLMPLRTSRCRRLRGSRRPRSAGRPGRCRRRRHDHEVCRRQSTRRELRRALTQIRQAHARLVRPREARRTRTSRCLSGARRSSDHGAAAARGTRESHWAEHVRSFRRRETGG